jgi:hypothetical protein
VFLLFSAYKNPAKTGPLYTGISRNLIDRHFCARALLRAALYGHHCARCAIAIAIRYWQTTHHQCIKAKLCSINRWLSSQDNSGNWALRLLR